MKGKGFQMAAKSRGCLICGMRLQEERVLKYSTKRRGALSRGVLMKEKPPGKAFCRRRGSSNGYNEQGGFISQGIRLRATCTVHAHNRHRQRWQNKVSSNCAAPHLAVDLMQAYVLIPANSTTQNESGMVEPTLNCLASAIWL